MGAWKSKIQLTLELGYSEDVDSFFMLFVLSIKRFNSFAYF